MKKLSVTGKMYLIEKEKQINDNFKVLDFVINQETVSETGVTYHNTIKFQASNAMCEQVNRFAVGSDVEVTFSIRGSKYEKNGKVQYFNNLNAYRIDLIQSEYQSPKPQSAQPQVNNFPPNEEVDNLPF